ncbi:MAG TPA: hypothetical protein VHF26_00190 [Trebonia sp.]|nr:hypothetical protein [Trebonia sp.]
MPPLTRGTGLARKTPRTAAPHPDRGHPEDKPEGKADAEGTSGQH